MTTATDTPEAPARLTPDLVSQLLKLPRPDRAELGHILLDSAEPTPAEREAEREAFRAKLQQIHDAVRNGTMKTYTIEETMAHLRAVAAEGGGS